MHMLCTLMKYGFVMLVSIRHLSVGANVLLFLTDSSYTFCWWLDITFGPSIKLVFYSFPKSSMISAQVGIVVPAIGGFVSIGSW